MRPFRFPDRVTTGFFNAAGRSPLVCVIALVMSLGVAKIARAEKDCPPPCVTCNANPKCGWYNNFCFCTIDADVTVLSDMTAEDPVLT